MREDQNKQGLSGGKKGKGLQEDHSTQGGRY